MIYGLLQRNFITAFIVLLLVTIAVWLPYCINPVIEAQSYDLYPMPLYKPLLSIFEFNPHLGLLLQVVCIGISIFLLSNINSRFRLIEKRSSFYIFLGILFAVILPEFQQFNPMIFASVLILWSFYSFFGLYKNERNLRHIYEAALLFSTAGLLYINVYFLILIIFFAVVILIPFNWRQWVSAILGILTPLFFLFSWVLIFDNADYFLSILKQNTIDAPYLSKFSLPFSYLDTAILALCTLILIVSIVFTFFGQTAKKTATSQYYTLLFLFLVFIIITYFAVPWVGFEIFYFCIIPAVFFIANYVCSRRKNRFPNILSFVLFALILITQFL